MELVALLVAGVAVWWFLSRSTKRAVIGQHTLLEPKPEPQPVEKSPDEKLADSLEALREAIREKTDADNQALRDQLEDANERLAAANELADDLGVAKAVTLIADEMQHWHAWSAPENEHFSKHLVEGLTYVGGSYVQDNRNETTINEFAVGLTRYRMSVANQQYAFDGGGRYADLILESFDGTRYLQVFTAEICKDGRDLAPWEVLHVTSIELGTWVQDMVSLEELFIARRERDNLTRQLEYMLPKVKNLKPTGEQAP